jgi:hypothetical protein
MYVTCSTTVQQGALDRWRPFRDASLPVFKKLYESVETGEETRRTLDVNSMASYKVDLDKDLAELANSEMWRTGKAVRGELRGDLCRPPSLWPPSLAISLYPRARRSKREQKA